MAKNSLNLQSAGTPTQHVNANATLRNPKPGLEKTEKNTKAPKGRDHYSITGGPKIRVEVEIIPPGSMNSHCGRPSFSQRPGYYKPPSPGNWPGAGFSNGGLLSYLNPTVLYSQIMQTLSMLMQMESMRSLISLFTNNSGQYPGNGAPTENANKDNGADRTQLKPIPNTKSQTSSPLVMNKFNALMTLSKMKMADGDGMSTGISKSKLNSIVMGLGGPYRPDQVEAATYFLKNPDDFKEVATLNGTQTPDHISADDFNKYRTDAKTWAKQTLLFATYKDNTPENPNDDAYIATNDDPLDYKRLQTLANDKTGLVGENVKNAARLYLQLSYDDPNLPNLKWMGEDERFTEKRLIDEKRASLATERPENDLALLKQVDNDSHGNGGGGNGGGGNGGGGNGGGNSGESNGGNGGGTNGGGNGSGANNSGNSGATNGGGNSGGNSTGGNNAGTKDGVTSIDGVGQNTSTSGNKSTTETMIEDTDTVKSVQLTNPYDKDIHGMNRNKALTTLLRLGNMNLGTLDDIVKNGSEQEKYAAQYFINNKDIWTYVTGGDNSLDYGDRNCAFRDMLNECQVTLAMAKNRWGGYLFDDTTDKEMDLGRLGVIARDATYAPEVRNAASQYIALAEIQRTCGHKGAKYRTDEEAYVFKPEHMRWLINDGHTRGTMYFSYYTDSSDWPGKPDEDDIWDYRNNNGSELVNTIR